MPAMTRQEKIMAYLVEQTGALELQSLPKSLDPLRTAAIAEAVEISPNNVSSLLTALYREGKVVRVGGRPVAYLSLAHLEERIGRSLLSNRFDDELAFAAACGQARQEETPEPPSKGERCGPCLTS